MTKFWKRDDQEMKKQELSLVKNSLISTVCKPLSMVIGYIYVPIALNYLGVEKYGVWSTILSILSWISFFDIGIGHGLRNRLTEALSRKSDESGELVSSAYAMIAVVMSLVTILFTGAAAFINWEKALGVENLQENLTAIIIVSFIFVAVNFVLSLCKNILFAYQKAASVSVMEVLVQLLNLAGILVVKQFVSGNLFLMAVIYGLSMIIVNLGVSIFLFSRHREVVPRIRKVNLQKGKSLFTLGLKFFVIQICALVLFTTDSLIISNLYGAMNVTPYSMVNRLFQAVTGVHLSMLGPIWSAVTKSKAEKDFPMIQSLTRKLVYVMIPFAVGTAGLVLLFRPIMHLWLGQDLEYSNALIILGGLYCFLNIWCNTYSHIANGLEILKPSMIIAVIQAVVNIPLSLFFAETLGMRDAGVLAGTVGSMLIAALVQPVFVYREIHNGLAESGERRSN